MKAILKVGALACFATAVLGVSKMSADLQLVGMLGLFSGLIILGLVAVLGQIERQDAWLIQDRYLLIFCVLLGFVFMPLAALVYLVSQPDLFFCHPEDKGAVVCARQWINAAGNVFAFAAASIAAFFAFRQAKAAQGSLAVATETARADRAWMMTSGLHFGGAQDSYLDGVKHSLVILVEAKWKNSGRTPALVYGIQLDVEQRPAGAPRPQFTPSVPTTGAPTGIGPGQQISSSPRGFPVDIIYQAIDGKWDLYVYSQIKYKDIYGYERKSEVTLKLDPVRTADPKEPFRINVQADGDRQEIT